MLDQATATGWVCVCGRRNVSLGCPRCGEKRPKDAAATPASALPRSTAWQPLDTPSRATKRVTPPVAPPVARPAPLPTFWKDVVAALLAPLGAKGSLMIAFGAFLGLAAQMTPILGFVIWVTYFWFFHNYFLKTIQTAAMGREELPDSPAGYEGLGVLGLLWLLVCQYVGLALPVIASLALWQLAPELVGAHLLTTAVVALAWPILAYPMTALLTTLTLNPLTSFHYIAIAGSIRRSASSYGKLVLVYVALDAVPHVVSRLVVDRDALSDPVALLYVAASIAWSMYAMIATGYLTGRFYVREKANLGWFNG